MTDNEKKMLCLQAIKAAENAYSPYSNFKVGSALLCDDGSVFLGCNVENASYSATTCAERVAIQTAVMNNKRNFKAIAIAGGSDKVGEILCPPCGVCRQVFAEFCNAETFLVLIAKKNGYEEYNLSQLLPMGFSKDNF